MPVLDVKFLDLGGRLLESQAKRNDTARRGAGDGVEIGSDRLTGRDLLLDQRQDSCGVDTADAASVK
jgi:hypothetical protein